MTESKDLKYSDETKQLELANQRKESELVLNTVLNSLKGIFPSWRGAIKSQLDLDNLKKEWLVAFVENGIRTDTQINKGLNLARKSTSPFIPPLGQFIEWCKVPTICTFIELDNLSNVKKLPANKLTKMLNDKAIGYTSVHTKGKTK